MQRRIHHHDLALTKHFRCILTFCGQQICRLFKQNDSVKTFLGSPILDEQCELHVLLLSFIAPFYLFLCSCYRICSRYRLWRSNLPLKALMYQFSLQLRECIRFLFICNCKQQINIGSCRGLLSRYVILWLQFQTLHINNGTLLVELCLVERIFVISDCIWNHARRNTNLLLSHIIMLIDHMQVQL